MVKPPHAQSNSSEVTVGISKTTVVQSIQPLHWVGYGLLILALFNLAEILIPPNLLNPVWEFQAIGAIVDQAPLMLVGLFLVFLVDRYQIAGWEKFVLKLLSRLALIIGLVYLLLIPLGIANTWRIHQQTNQEINAQVQQKQVLIQQVKGAVGQVKTANDLEQLISSLNRAGVAPEIDGTEQLAQVKAKLNESIAEGEQQLQAQVQEARSGQLRTLLKRSVKWNLGALVAGCFFVSIWRGTRWARQGWQDF